MSVPQAFSSPEKLIEALEKNPKWRPPRDFESKFPSNQVLLDSLLVVSLRFGRRKIATALLNRGAEPVYVASKEIVCKLVEDARFCSCIKSPSPSAMAVRHALQTRVVIRGGKLTPRQRKVWTARFRCRCGLPKFENGKDVFVHATRLGDRKLQHKILEATCGIIY